MTKTAQEIIALFNISKSGKSYLQVVDGTMLTVSTAIHALCVSGKVDTVTFAAGEDLMNEDGTTAFKTMRAAGFTESVTAKLEKAAAITEAYSRFDSTKFAEALTAANTITF